MRMTQTLSAGTRSVSGVRPTSCPPRWTVAPRGELSILTMRDGSSGGTMGVRRRSASWSAGASGGASAKNRRASSADAVVGSASSCLRSSRRSSRPLDSEPDMGACAREGAAGEAQLARHSAATAPRTAQLNRGFVMFDSVGGCVSLRPPVCEAPLAVSHVKTGVERPGRSALHPGWRPPV
jgi:hypothetical protein